MSLAPPPTKTPLRTVRKSTLHQTASDGHRQCLTVIEPPGGFQPVNVAEIWRFRELFGCLIWRDIKVKYRQTILGAAWAILQPVMMMVVFTIFFGRLAKLPGGSLPYPIFVYAGLLPWMFFSTAVINAANSVVGAERLITRVYFPRLLIPFSCVGAAALDFAIAFAVLLLMMAGYGIFPTLELCLAPLLFVPLLLLAAGVGALLAALNVTFRDFRYVIPFGVQLWMFATPSIYMDPTVGGMSRFHALLLMNPLSPLVAAFRASVTGRPIVWLPALIAAGAAVTMLLLGCLYFRRVEDRFCDVI
jgi:lipopolysaccharide transport system permease protein